MATAKLTVTPEETENGAEAANVIIKRFSNYLGNLVHSNAKPSRNFLVVPGLLCILGLKMTLKHENIGPGTRCQ